MNCTTMREAMLVAAPEELRGEGMTPLATHLRDCAQCRMTAARLSRTTLLLAHTLHGATRRRAQRRARAKRRVVAGFAVAATILIAVRVHNSPPAHASIQVSAVPDSGWSAEVIHTSNPDITFVRLSAQKTR